VRAAVLRPYRRVLATPGATAFCAAGLVMRMPISMLTLGTVLLISASSGTYGLAGAVSATTAAVGALLSPLLARLVDRYGQGRLLLPALAVHAAGFGALVAFALTGAPAITLFLAAAVYGSAYLPVGSLVRARWAYVVEDRRQLATAYSLEAVLDEVIFIVGPVLVTLLATRVTPAAGLAAALLLVAVGTIALAVQRRTEPPAGVISGWPHPSALRARGLPLLALVSVPLGGLFGSVEVITVAFTAERGQPAAAGLVLALFACGSLIAGLCYGAVRWRASLRIRFVVGLSALAAAISLLLLASTVPVLAALMFLAGFAISPTVIAAFTLTEALVPAAARTEGLSWLTTGVGIGLALASSVAGHVIDIAGARTAYWVTVACGLSAALLAIAALPRWRPRPAQSVRSGTHS
jgi:MFS family permease